MSRQTRPLLQIDSGGRPLPTSGDFTTFRGEYVGTNLVYAGFARPGADEGNNVWQLMKLTYAGTNLINIKWPKISGTSPVSADYEFNWTNRAGYTYA